MRHHPARAFSLIELVVYVAIATVLGAMMTIAFTRTLHAYQSIAASRSLNDGAITVLGRMERDIRSASLVDTVQSSFNTDQGRLVLSVMNASGTTRTVEYRSTGGTIHLYENGTDKGILLPSSVHADGLVFSYIATGRSTGIKTDLHLSSVRGTASVTEHFYTTTMLRGSY